MEEKPEMDAHTFLQKFRASGLYYDLLSEAQSEIVRLSVKPDELTAQVVAFLKSSGMYFAEYYSSSRAIFLFSTVQCEADVC